MSFRSDADIAARIDAIEAVIHRDVGRNVDSLFAASRGGLRGAVDLVSRVAGPVGLITGFFVPSGTPPAAETDGPVAAALLARGFHDVGFSVRLCTDAPCENACRVALRAAGVLDAEIDVVAAHRSVEEVVSIWRARGVALALSIERCGRTADGTFRNMRGRDVGAWTTGLDDLFAAGPWQTVAVGDGGNEIGMGALPADLIAAHVANGAAIRCVTPAEHLIVAGVSHWGAYALLAGLSVARLDWWEAIARCLDPELDRAILAAVVRDGPAVDGTTGQQAMTIDGFDVDTNHRILLAIRELAARDL